MGTFVNSNVNLKGKGEQLAPASNRQCASLPPWESVHCNKATIALNWHGLHVCYSSDAAFSHSTACRPAS